MKSVDEVRKIVLDKTHPKDIEEVPLLESGGLFLGSDLESPEDQPPFDTSAMDGFAIQVEDTVEGEVELEVVENIPAGVQPRRKIEPGQAAQIMTGAPVPDGADGVVPVENTSGFGEDKVTIRGTVAKGAAIRKRGENISRGDIALRWGSRIRPEEVMILASMGISQVPVRKRPQVALIATGDELVEIEKTPDLGQIRNSSSYMLRTLVARLQLEGNFLGIARDRREATQELVVKGLESDVLVLTGGVSMGERDFVGEVLAEEGVEIHVEKINLKPGKPMVFGTRGNQLVFGLPGNPVSSLVTFLLFVEPALKKMMGHPDPHPARDLAVLSSPLRPYSRERYLPAVFTQGRPNQVELLSWKGSGDVFALARANCMAVIPPDQAMKEGDEITVLPRW